MPPKVPPKKASTLKHGPSPSAIFAAIEKRMQTAHPFSHSFSCPEVSDQERQWIRDHCIRIVNGRGEALILNGFHTDGAVAALKELHALFKSSGAPTPGVESNPSTTNQGSSSSTASEASAVAEKAPPSQTDGAPSPPLLHFGTTQKLHQRRGYGEGDSNEATYTFYSDGKFQLEFKSGTGVPSAGHYGTEFSGATTKGHYHLNRLGGWPTVVLDKDTPVMAGGDYQHIEPNF